MPRKSPRYGAPALYNASPPTYNDGDAAALQVDSSGNLKVTSSGGGSGGLSVVDQSAFAAGTSPFTPGGGEYNSTPQTLTSGQQAMLALDQNRNTQTNAATLFAGEDLTNNVLGILEKPVVGSQYASGVYMLPASTTAANIKSTAGNLFSFFFSSVNSGLRYLQFFNTTTAPTTGNTALLYFILGAGNATQPSTLMLGSDFFAPTDYFSTGISFGISTTATTYTAGTSTDHTLMINYM